MGKNYVENSLKRFLKRKVKITLGVVVTFLITGAVSFGAGIDRNDYPLMNEENNKVIDMGYINAMESLNGLGSGNLKTGEISLGTNASQKIKVIEKDGNYTISYVRIGTLPNDSLKSVTISKDMLSEKTIANINKFLNSQNKEYILTENSITTDIKENQFIQNNTKEKFVQQATGTNNITNNGYILAARGQLVENGEAINNGTIMVGSSGQSASKGSGNLINNGFIKVSTNGQVVDKGKAYNYGTIIGGTYLQSTTQSMDFVTGGELYNYGVLKSTNTSTNVVQGQNIDAKGSKAYNYGLIDGAGNLQYSTRGRWSTLLSNYGTLNINSQDGVAQVLNEGSSKNYGLIKVINGAAVLGRDDGIIGTTTNRGVIHSSGNSEIYKNVKNIDNTGIIITNADLSDKEWSKTGVTLNGSYELQNTDTAVTITGNTLDKSSFGDKNIGYINATSNTTPIKLSEITREGDKKLLGVVADDKITVFESDNNLLLDGIDMTGYLINGGTFIDMKGNSLILSDVNITVTEDLTKTKGEKAVAVDLGKTGNLTLMGESKINGVIKGGASSKLEALAQQGPINTETEGKLTFKNVDSESLKEVNYTDVTLEGTKAGSIVSEFKHTSEGKENTITIGEKFVVGDEKGDYTSKDVITDTSLAGNKVNYIIKDLDNIHGNIELGAGENTVTANSKFEKYDGTINLGTGANGTFIADGTGYKDNVFNYNVVNADVVELQGGTWGDWSEAKGTIKFEGNKAGNKPTLRLGNDTTMHITLNAEKDHGSDFANYVGDDLKLSHAVITGTGNKAVAKYQIDETNGLDTEKLNSTKYSFGEGVSYKDSPIFNISSEEGTGVNISLKTAADLGLSGQQRVIYDAYIKQIIADGSVNKGVINKINNMNNQNDMVNLIKKTDVNGRAYYTAGSVVTKDIVNSYVSSVEEFKPRAEKGQWLAQGKYINSDTEFDGGSKVKGYDGDITGTVGMIEYGFTDNTSYGAVFGQGDAEMDINGGGKLDGDNIYAGLYMKHRTANGIELVGNIGYVKSDMDSDLRNDFTTKGEGLSIEGSTTEKGTADSSAVILSLKGRKDYKITDTVKVQPIFGARATFINQEKAENPEMNFTVAEQDIIVLEGTAGMGIAKEFALPQGILELNAGAEYTFAATSSNNDAEYTLFEGDYQATHIKMDDVDAAENTGTVFVGADYEHENGVGFNAKYEMMWSDKGDDSRVTAGISYRF